MGTKDHPIIRLLRRSAEPGDLSDHALNITENLRRLASKAPANELR